jgi:uncharacterized membrane protein (UPF0127 family)
MQDSRNITKALINRSAICYNRSMETYYKAINLTTGQIIADKVKIAQDFKSRSVGLLNRTSLGDGEALLIKPCNSIHMFFMKFPIDVVFLNKNGNVVKTKKSLLPWRLAQCLISNMTLELKAGTIDRCSIKTGDSIKFESIL